MELQGKLPIKYKTLSIPMQYELLNYIEKVGSNTAYVDVNYVPNNLTKATLEFELTNWSSNRYQLIAGVYNNLNDHDSEFYFSCYSASGGRFLGGIFNSESFQPNPAVVAQLNTKYRSVLSSNGFQVQDAVSDPFNVSEFTCASSFYLFRCSKGKNTNEYATSDTCMKEKFILAQFLKVQFLNEIFFL